MDTKVREDVNRLASDAAIRSQDLQVSARRKLRMKKRLSIASGLLALVSAGTMTTVLVAALGDRWFQILAAATAALSGTITLFLNYFSDDDVARMFTGSSKYFALRENLSQLVLPGISDKERFAELTKLRQEYIRLDESYSRFRSFPRPLVDYDSPV